MIKLTPTFNGIIKKYTRVDSFFGGKDRPFTKVDGKEFTRRPKHSKNISILGPFPDGHSLRNILGEAIKLLQLRDCTTSEFSKRKYPCLLYQMEQCLAPCVRLCTAEQYQEKTNLLIDFMRKPRKNSRLYSFCQEKMNFFSKSEKFEKASQWRDFWKSLDVYIEGHEGQRVENLTSDDHLDFIGYAVATDECDISIYSVRAGRLIAVKHFYWLRLSSDKNEDEIFSNILQYYSAQLELPEKVIIRADTESLENLQLAFKEIVKDRNIQVNRTNSKFKNLQDQAMTHAEEKQRIRLQEQKFMMPKLQDLQLLLQLKHIPRVIECFDIAIWQGASPTASQVVFVDGRPSKADYRYYHLDQVPEMNNDFAMMKEVLTRRLKRGKLPDLIVIDGGKGQLNIAVQVCQALNIDIPLVALAKEKKAKNVYERIYQVGKAQPLVLDYSSLAAQLLTHLRDEAHRFSRRLHHHAEKKRVLGL